MSTYTPIASQTLNANTGAVTFSSIPQGYTDLVIVANTKAGATDNPIYMRFNSDSANNYSATRLNGNGSSAASSRTSNNSAMFPSWAVAPGTSEFSHNMTVHIQNYSNSTTYKTALSRANNTDSGQGTEATVGLWRSTSAITAIELFLSATTFSSGSTFSLYGIQAGDKAQKAQGGNIVTSDGTYVYHTFISSGAFIPSQALTVDYLVVAGGGAGGGTTGGGGGGGGAGGVRSTVSATGGGGTVESALSLTSGTVYPVTVGAGGAGVSGNNGSQGSNSVFSTITSTGGGYGAKDIATGAHNGGNGGSGGGSAGGAGGVGGTGTANQGRDGGSTDRGAGGGSDTAASTSTAGSGVFNTITGTSIQYAGGGGAYGLSGGGGGAASGSSLNVQPSNATANTGGGGAGSWSSPSSMAGSNGGSGIVIIRYLA